MTLNFVLEFLLWLGLISGSPTTPYSVQQIQQMRDAHIEQINAVYSDPAQHTQLDDEFLNSAKQLDVIDRDGWQ